MRNLTAGLAMTLGVLIPIAAAAVVAAQGNLRGLEAGFRGVSGIGASAKSLAPVYIAGIPGTILLIIGSGLLTVQLLRAGDSGISTIALVLVSTGLAVALVEGAFQASVTVWAGRLHDATGEVPEIYEPLRIWLNLWLQRAWVPMVLVGFVGYGWAITRSDLLPAWVGWVAIAFCALLLIQMMAQGEIVVAFVFAAPLLIGVAVSING